MGALVGNTSPNKTLITFNITGLSIANGAAFWIRWNDFAASGADDGLAVDDLTINFNGAAVPPCTEQVNPPSSPILTPTATTMTGSFTVASPAVDEYLVIRSTSNLLSASPTDGVVYSAGQSIGGGIIVSGGTATTFTDNGLNANTTYYYFVFALNSDACTGGPNYLTTLVNGTSLTLPLAACVTPASAPTDLSLTPSNNSISGSFTVAAGANRNLVVRSNSATLSATPANGITYTTNRIIVSGTVVAYSNASTFPATSLSA